MPVSKVIDVVSLDEFKKIIQDEKKVSVAHFWASWANQCAPMDEALKVLADEVDSTAANFLRVSMYILDRKKLVIDFCANATDQ